MLGLLKAPDRPVIEDMDRGDVHLGENGNGNKSSAPTDGNGIGTKGIATVNRRRLTPRVLQTTMIGPHMILVPRPEYDRGTGRSRPTPTLE